MLNTNAIKQTQNNPNLPPISVLTELVWPKFDGLMAELGIVTRTLNPVELVTPTNLLAAKERWLESARAGKFTNPEFVYDREQAQAAADKRKLLRKARQALDKMAPGDQRLPADFLRHLARGVIDDALLSVEIAEGILTANDARTAEAVWRKYGKLSPELCVQARQRYEAMVEAGADADGAGGSAAQAEADANAAQGEIARGGSSARAEAGLGASAARGKAGQGAVLLKPYEIAQLKRLRYDGAAIRDAFGAVLARYNFNSWTAAVDDGLVAIDARDKSADGGKTVVVPLRREVNGAQLCRLVTHEIESHVRVSANGETLLRGFGGGALRTDDETLYEGHAIWQENQIRRQV